VLIVTVTVKDHLVVDQISEAALEAPQRFLGRLALELQHPSRATDIARPVAEVSAIATPALSCIRARLRLMVDRSSMSLPASAAGLTGPTTLMTVVRTSIWGSRSQHRLPLAYARLSCLHGLAARAFMLHPSRRPDDHARDCLFIRLAALIAYVQSVVLGPPSDGGYDA
jgi:hypothetical protein